MFGGLHAWEQALAAASWLQTTYACACSVRDVPRSKLLGGGGLATMSRFAPPSYTAASAAPSTIEPLLCVSSTSGNACGSQSGEDPARTRAGRSSFTQMLGRDCRDLRNVGSLTTFARFCSQNTMKPTTIRAIVAGVQAGRISAEFVMFTRSFP